MKQGLDVSLRILEKLNKVNHDRSEAVPYEAFYIPELTENVDVRIDYLHWLQCETTSRAVQLFFCNFPFVFDAQAKTILMQTDAVLQMQHAMDEVYRQNIASFFFPVDPSNPYLILHVSRENLVRETLNQLEKKDKTDLKKPLKVTFYGEDAVDAGGVRKEFFMLLLRDIIDPKYGMFKLYEETNCIWFNEKTFEEDLLFRLIGILCGLAIYNGNIINLPFPLALYKKLLNEELKLDDLRGLSPSMTKSLRAMLDYEDEDFEDIFMLKFEASIETFSQIETYELKPGGSNISVTKENREEYVNLYIDLLLNKLVEKPYSAFHDGFHKVCGGRVLELFHAQELMAMIVGNEHYDWQELEDNTEYKGEFSKNHPTIRFFWEVFHELNLDQKKQFLLFLTGYDRIPIFGMKSVKLTIQPAGSDGEYLPVAHTCFNLLDLPRYTNKARLCEKLLQAIQHCQGFALA